MVKLAFSLTAESLARTEITGAPLATPVTVTEVDADRPSVLITVKTTLYDNDTFNELPLTNRVEDDVVFVHRMVSQDSPYRFFEEMVQFHR